MISNVCSGMLVSYTDVVLSGKECKRLLQVFFIILFHGDMRVRL